MGGDDDDDDDEDEDIMTIPTFVPKKKKTNQKQKEYRRPPPTSHPPLSNVTTSISDKKKEKEEEEDEEDKEEEEKSPKEKGKKKKRMTLEELYGEKIQQVTWDILTIAMHDFSEVKGGEILKQMQGPEKEQVNSIMNSWINARAHRVYGRPPKEFDIENIRWPVLLEVLKTKGWRRNPWGLGTLEEWIARLKKRHKQFKTTYENKVLEENITKRDKRKWEERIKNYSWLVGADASKRTQKYRIIETLKSL